MTPPTPPTDRDATARTGTVVGTVVGPSEAADEFEFVVPGETDLRTGAFVVTESRVREQGREVLSRVTNTMEERGLPGGFSASPEVDPERVADALGVPTDEAELDRVTARVIGYFDRDMGTFRNPRTLPDAGTSVSRASDAFLEAVVPAADWEGDAGVAHLGWLLERAPRAANVFLPIDDVAATHLAILASTGSGKSYTASVLLEELVRPDSRAAVLVFDPHGEYTTLREVRREEHADVFQTDEFSSADGYTPAVDIVQPDEVSVAIPDLNFGDLLALLDDLSSKMEAVLHDAWGEVSSGANQITVSQLIDACEQADDGGSTADALRWRLRKALDTELFTPAATRNLTDYVSPGQITVLELDRLRRADQQMLAAVLLRKLYEARRDAVRTNGDSGLDFPLFTLLEEGHRFAPDGDARSLGTLRTILSEGRKFGFGVGIVSQRPSKLDSDVLSQCGTQIVMQIQNPADQQAIRDSVEDAGDDILAELPGLTPGQAVVAGDAVNTPVLLRVRERHTTHGAESLDATRRWRDAWERREREDSRGTANAYETENAEEPEL